MTNASQSNTFEQFIQCIKDWLADLGVNFQLFEEMAGDKHLPMSVRTLAVGVLAYPNAPVHLIPNKVRFIGLIDDALVMIVGLALIVPQLPEESAEYYRRKYSGVERIEAYESIARRMLGILWERLVLFVKALQNRTYKGKIAEEIAQSAELRDRLFDEAMIFAANLGFNPETMETKILPPPEKIIGLLSSGLEETQEDDAE